MPVAVAGIVAAVQRCRVHPGTVAARGGYARDAGFSPAWSSVVICHHEPWSDGVNVAS